MVLKRRGAAIQALTLVVAFAPLAELVWRLASGQIFEPIEAITQRTGQTALWLLGASLACSPAYSVFGVRWVLPLRRTLGLSAFAYATLHLFTLIGLDFGFDIPLIVSDGLPERPFILVGLSAYLLLSPLAITSTRGWMRRLGKRWKLLHRAVFVAIVLVVVHYTWAVKPGLYETWPWAVGIGVLLLVRIPLIRENVVKLRRRVRSS